MTGDEIKAAAEVLKRETGLNDYLAQALAEKVLEAAETERRKLMEGLFGPEYVR
jgi:hypothetical protein